MKEHILITDSLFISKKHENLLKENGFDISRVDNPCLSEDELIKELKGKTGYILGGLERVTDKVIESTDALKAISFTGAGYKEFIPGYKKALEKGILISNAPGGNTTAVAEYTLTLILMMSRKVLSLGRTGDVNFKTVKSIHNQNIGIVGLGRIGLLLCRYLKALGVKNIYYYSKNRKYNIESELNIQFMPKSDLFSICDIVSLHCSKDAGNGFITSYDLDLLKEDSIIINNAFAEIIDTNHLIKLLKEEKVFAAFDNKIDGVSNIPIDRFFYSNTSTAFNTEDAIDLVSDMTTKSIINLIINKKDIFSIQ